MASPGRLRALKTFIAVSSAAIFGDYFLRGEFVLCCVPAGFFVYVLLAVSSIHQCRRIDDLCTFVVLPMLAVAASARITSSETLWPPALLHPIAHLLIFDTMRDHVRPSP